MYKEIDYAPHEDNYFYKSVRGQQRVQMDWDKMNPTVKAAILYWYKHDCTLRDVGEIFDISLATLETTTNYLRNSNRTPDFPSKHYQKDYIKDFNLYQMITMRYLNKLNIVNIGKFTGIKRWTVENCLKKYGFYFNNPNIDSLDKIADEIINKDNDTFNKIIYNLDLYSDKYNNEFGSPEFLLRIIKMKMEDSYTCHI